MANPINHTIETHLTPMVCYITGSSLTEIIASQAARTRIGSVVTQCRFSYCNYSKPSGSSEEVLLDSAGSLIVIIASQAARTRKCCYTVLVLLLRL